MSKLNIYLINFGLPLNKDVIQNIKTEQQCEVNIIDISVRLNLQKFVYIQIVDIIDRLPLEFINSSYLVINLPTLSVAGVYIVNEIYARTHKLPYILELKRTKINGVVSEFKFSKIRNLQLEVMCTRNNSQRRKNGKLNTKESDI